MHLSRRRITEIASLSQRKYRRRYRQFVVEGERAVESAVFGSAVLSEVVHLTDAPPGNELLAHLSRTAVPVIPVEPAVFNRFSDVENAQGILAIAAIPDASVEDVLAEPRVIALDALQDPGNVGTLIRTAAWFGIRGIVVGKGTADPYMAKAVRASMGGIFDVAIYEAEDLASLLADAATRGFEVVAADMEGEPLSSWRPAERTVLVLGNEGAGLSDAVTMAVHRRITIPGGAGEGVESLNVAIAAGIMMNVWVQG
jgi:RNA methyltransferase, TrmH family